MFRELEESSLKSLNLTDPECVRVKGRQGIHAGYNGQRVVDEKHGLIAHGDVVAENNDNHPFSSQSTQ